MGTAPWRASLPAIISRSIFVLYLAMASVVTALELWAEYRGAREMIKDEIRVLSSTMLPSAVNALWDYQEAQLAAIADGMMQSGTLVSVSIVESQGRMRVTRGDARLASEGLRQVFPLVKSLPNGQQQVLGEITLASSYAVVVGRIQLTVILTLAGAAIKTLCLWLVIVSVVRRFLSVPLTHLAHAVREMDLLGPEPPRLATVLAKGTELAFLKEQFEALAANTHAAGKRLEQINQALEERVRQRTAKLECNLKALAQEMSERERAESIARQERDFTHELMRAVPGVMFLLSRDAYILLSNPAAELALPGRPLLGAHLLDFVAPKDRPAVSSVLDQVTASTEGEVEAELESPGNAPHPYHLVARRVRLRDQEQVLVVGVDMTTRRKADARMRHLAHHDSLTGLPNRVALEDRLTLAIANARRRNEPLALLFVDLDGFKDVNDRHGHDTGDWLLKEIASRFGDCLREVDTLARIGGDEFLIIAPGSDAHTGSRRIAEALLQCAARPAQSPQGTLNVGASIGIAFFPEDGVDGGMLKEAADAAMYRVKARGKGGYDYAQPQVASLATTNPAASPRA